MNDQANRSPAANMGRGFWWSPLGLVTAAALAIGGAALLWSERPYLLSWLPWLVFLACPLLHVFMHRDHSRDGEAGVARGDERDSSKPHQH